MPEVVVLDTNIVSYLMKGHELACSYRRHLEGKTLAVSFMTVAELYEGAYRRGWGRRKMTALEAELRKYLVIPYSPRT
jgi:tRNA(fMet)-specific endonuclease VapC